MNCIHCNEPGAHPGTRKCTDLHACHGRQEYARGVEDERARVVADLVKSADRASDDKMGPVKIVLLNAAIRFERGGHESESVTTAAVKSDDRCPFPGCNGVKDHVECPTCGQEHCDRCY